METLLRVVRELKEENQKLRDEIDRLKGLPEKPKRPPQPSPLNDPEGKPSGAGLRKKPTVGKRPGSVKRKKTAQLTIHQDVPLHLDGLPPETKFLGYRDFTVQDLRIESFNTRYRRARYRLPDGSFLTAPLPESVASHFGHTLQAYVLYQHHHNQVTQPLLLEELGEFGMEISAGQINRFLSEGHEAFHQEKDSLLPAAREVSSYLHTDDTSARHRGKGNHTLHIGNELFASFFTTETKSRVNFLKILNSPFTDYVLNGDAMIYLEQYDLPRKLMTLLKSESAGGVFENDQAWEAQLESWGITSKEQRRLVTEAALWASLMSRGLYRDLTLISDDAAQFKVLGLLNALCWIHCERHVARLIALFDSERAALDRARDAIWKYYQRLKKFRDSPTPHRRERLEKQFDRLFQQKTGWEELDEALRKMHVRKEPLLLVLDHPEIPLHNNLSENDIRQYVKKRKISAGTRSDLGRRCRDTFLSLKTTCRKLGYRFWGYLLDRLQGVSNIPPLAEAIRSRATQAGRT